MADLVETIAKDYCTRHSGDITTYGQPPQGSGQRGSTPTGRAGSEGSGTHTPVSGTPPELLAIRAEIENYRDNAYVYDLLMNAYNTYAGQTFEPNALQSVGEWFGDTSARQNFLNQQVAGLRQEIAEILKANHIEDVSSAVSELTDMKKAGVNVDLQGGEGISPKEAAEIDNSDLANPVVNEGGEVVSQMFSAGAQIVSFAMQAYQGFMNVKSMHLENLSKELSLSSSARDLAWNVIGEGVTEFMTSPTFDESLKDDPSSVALVPSLIQSFGSRINSLPLSRKQRKYLHSVIDELVYSYDNDGKKVPTAKYQTLVNDTLKRLYGSRADATQEYGRIGADIEDIAVQRVVSHDIYRPLNEMALELQNDMNYLNKLMVQFDTSYYTTANKLGVPSMSAKADFVSRKMQYEIKKVQTRITSTFNAIDKKLEANTKLGPNWKMAFQTALAIGESWTINTMMNGLKSFNFSPKFSFSSNHDNYNPSY